MVRKLLLCLIVLFVMVSPSYGQQCQIVRDVVFFKWCDEISFEWDPNQETDLAGYRLYRNNTEGGFVSYSTDQNTPNFIEATAAPIVTITVTNVPPGLWFWRLTAFDTNNNESDFSTHVVSYHLGFTGPPGVISSTTTN